MLIDFGCECCVDIADCRMCVHMLSTVGGDCIGGRVSVSDVANKRRFI